jgi:hypothetical protein
MTTEPKRAALVADVTKWEETQARWAAESAICEAEMDGIRERMGEAVLADETQAQILSTKLRDLADRADVARRTAAAVTPKLKASRSAVLEYDACRFDEQADRHEKVLQEHHAKTAKLLVQLEQHEGHFVHERSVTLMGDGVAEITGELPKSHELELRVRRARTKAEVHREWARGVDPMGPDGCLTSLTGRDGLVYGLPLTDYFSSAAWGPDAVVPAPAYERRVEAVRAELEQHDAEAEVDVSPRITELEGKIEKLNAEINGRLRERGKPTRDESETLSGWRFLITELETKRATASERRAEIVARLEALIGEPESATA